MYIVGPYWIVTSKIPDNEDNGVVKWCNDYKQRKEWKKQIRKGL